MIDSPTLASQTKVKVAAASRRCVLASTVNSVPLTSQTPATSLPSSPVSAFCIQHSEFTPNVLKCPVLSGLADPADKTKLSTDQQTTCEQILSSPDQTSVVPEPSAGPQNQTPESGLQEQDAHASPQATTA